MNGGDVRVELSVELYTVQMCSRNFILGSMLILGNSIPGSLLILGNSIPGSLLILVMPTKSNTLNKL